MSNLNRVMMIGRLTADPELRTVGNSKQLSQFGLATNYNWKNNAGTWNEGVDFHRVVAWDKLGTRVATAYKKGDQVYIEGKLRTRVWTNQQGEKQWSTEVVAQRVLSMMSSAGKQAAKEAEQTAIESEVQSSTEMEELVYEDKEVSLAAA